MIKERNPPLMINVHVIDNKTDEREKTIQYSLRKVEVDPQKFTSMTAANEELKKQQSAVDMKVQKMVKLLIWAMNNGKVLEFVNAKEDQ